MVFDRLVWVCVMPGFGFGSWMSQWELWVVGVNTLARQSGVQILSDHQRSCPSVVAI
jgi:hypothetical protein